MSARQISEQPPPHIDPSKAPVAFGVWALEELSARLRDPELQARQTALASLCDLLHDPERAYEAILHGCMELLKRLLEEDDVVVKVKTTEALHVLAGYALGRDAIVKCKVLELLGNMLNDPSDVCRRNVLQTLNKMAEFPAGAALLVSMGLVPRLVSKVSGEPEEICVPLLLTLSGCVRVNALPALDCHAVSVLKDPLSHASPKLRQAATSALVGISVPASGKVKVCEENLMPKLVKLLSDDDQEVVANAAGALMNTAVINAGKYAALEAGALAPLLQLTSSTDTTVCTNALRALTVLAEVPSAREQLLEHVSTLSAGLSRPEPIIQRATATAIQVISWKP